MKCGYCNKNTRHRYCSTKCRNLAFWILGVMGIKPNAEVKDLRSVILVKIDAMADNLC